jgi:membrane associated rhomboid family serine protease
MGISDRPYYRDDEQGTWLGHRSMVINLILLNVAVFVAQLLFGNDFTNRLSLHADLFREPWNFYQLLTYGFLHDPENLTHILFNMLGLWIFGTDLEGIYGRAEILRIYLATIVVAGLVWVIVATVGQGGPGVLLGASGGVMGMMILYVLHFPRRTLLIWGILPVPAWALGVVYVAMDLLGAASPTDNVAHVAHLSGVAFGFVYFKSGWNLGRLIPQRLSGSMFRFRPKLRIHDPEEASRDLSNQVDAILEKISQQGEASLTKKERRTLEEASRRYQRKRQ